MPLFGKFRAILRRSRHVRTSDTTESDLSKERLVVTVDRSDGISGTKKNKKNQQNKPCPVEAELDVTSQSPRTCKEDRKCEPGIGYVAASNLVDNPPENTVRWHHSPSPKSTGRRQHGSSPEIRQLSPRSWGARSKPSANSDLCANNTSDQGKHTATTSLFTEQRGEQYKRASDHELDPRRYSGRPDPAKGEAEVGRKTVASGENFSTRLATKVPWYSSDLEDSVPLLYCSVMDEMMDYFSSGTLPRHYIGAEHSEREAILSPEELSSKEPVIESASGAAVLPLLGESAQDLKRPKPGSSMTYAQYKKLQAAMAKVARSSMEGTAGHPLMSEGNKPKIQRGVSDGADVSSKLRTENAYQRLPNSDCSKSHQTETESTLDGISQLPSDRSDEVESLVQLSYLAFVRSREGLSKNHLGVLQTVCIGSDGRHVITAAPCTVVEKPEPEMDGINLELIKDQKASSTSGSPRRSENPPRSSVHFRHSHDGKKFRCEPRSPERKCCMDLMAETCRVSNLRTDSFGSAREAGSELLADFQPRQRTDQKRQGNQHQSGMRCLNAGDQTQSDDSSSLDRNRFKYGRSLIPCWKQSESKGKPVTNTSTSTAISSCPNLLTDSALCTTATPEWSCDSHDSLDESPDGHCLCCPLNPSNTNAVLYSDYLYLLRMHNYYVGRFDPIPASLLSSILQPRELADPVLQAQLQALQSTGCPQDAVRVAKGESVPTLGNGERDIRMKKEGVPFRKLLKHEAVQTRLTCKHGKEREQQKKACLKEVEQAVKGYQEKEKAAPVQGGSGTKDREEHKQERAEERKYVRDEAVQTPRMSQSRRCTRPVEEKPDRDDSPGRSARHSQQQLKQREFDDLETVREAYRTSLKLPSKHGMKSSEPSSPEQVLDDDETRRGRQESKQNSFHQSPKLRFMIEGASALEDLLESSKPGPPSKQSVSTEIVVCCLGTDQTKGEELFRGWRKNKQSAAQSPVKVYEELSKFSLELLETLEKGNLRWSADEHTGAKESRRPLQSPRGGTEHLLSRSADKLLLCGAEDVEQAQNIDCVEPTKRQPSFAAIVEHQKDTVAGGGPGQTTKLKTTTTDREPSGVQKIGPSDARQREPPCGTDGKACSCNSQQPCHAQGAGEKQCICCGEFFTAQSPTKRKSLKKSVEDMFNRGSKKQPSHWKRSSKASGDGSAQVDAPTQENKEPQASKKPSRASTKRAVKRSCKSQCAEHDLQPCSKLVKTDTLDMQEGPLKGKSEQQLSRQSSTLNVADGEQTATKADSQAARKGPECPSDAVDASQHQEPECEKSKCKGDWAHSFPTHKVSKKIIAKLQATANMLYLGNDVYAVKRKSLPLEVQQELKLKESAGATKNKDVVASVSAGKDGAAVEDVTSTAQRADSEHKIAKKHSSHRPEKIVVMSKNNVDYIRSQLGASKKKKFFRKPSVPKKSHSANDTSQIPGVKDAAACTEAACSKPSSQSDKASDTKSKTLLKLIRYLHSSKNKFLPKNAGSPVIFVPAFVSKANIPPGNTSVCVHTLNSEKDLDCHHSRTTDQKSMASKTVHQNVEKKGHTEERRKSNKGSPKLFKTEANYSSKETAETTSECPQVAQKSPQTQSHNSPKQKRGNSKNCDDDNLASKDSALRSLIADILASLSNPHQNERGKKGSPIEKLKSEPSNRDMSDTFTSDSDRPCPQQSPAFIPDTVKRPRKFRQGHSVSDFNTSQSQSESDCCHRMQSASTPLVIPLSMSENMAIISDDFCLSSAKGDSVGFTCNVPCSKRSVKLTSEVASISTLSSEVVCEGWQANRKRRKSCINRVSASNRLTTKPPLPIKSSDTPSDEEHSVNVCAVPTSLRLISESDEGNGPSVSKNMAVDRFSCESTASGTATNEGAATPVSDENAEHGVLTSAKKLARASQDASHAGPVPQSWEWIGAPSSKSVMTKAPTTPLFKRNAHKVQSKTSVPKKRCHATNDSHTCNTSPRLHCGNGKSPVAHRRYESLPVAHRRYNVSPVTHDRRSPTFLQQYGGSPTPHDRADRSPILPDRADRSPMVSDRSDRPPMSHDCSDVSPISCGSVDRSLKSHECSDTSPAAGDRSGRPSERRDRCSIPSISPQSGPSPVSDSSDSGDIHALTPPRGTSPGKHTGASSKYQGSMPSRESIARGGRSASRESLALGERESKRRDSGQDGTKSLLHSRGERESRGPYSSLSYLSSSKSFCVEGQTSVQTSSLRTGRPVTYQRSESIRASQKSHQSLSRKLSDISEYLSSVDFCSPLEQQNDYLHKCERSERAPRIKSSCRQHAHQSLEDIQGRLRECSHKDRELRSYSSQPNSTSGSRHKSRQNISCESSTSDDMCVLNSRSKSHQSKSEQSFASKSILKHQIDEESDPWEEPVNVHFSENGKSPSVDPWSGSKHTSKGSSPEVTKKVRSVSVQESKGVSEKTKRKSSASSVCSDVKTLLDASSECSDLKRSMDSIAVSEKIVRRKSSGSSVGSDQRISSVVSDQRRLLESTAVMEKAVRKKSSGSLVRSDKRSSVSSNQRKSLESTNTMEKTVRRKSSGSSVHSGLQKSLDFVSASERTVSEETVRQKSSASSVGSDLRRPPESVSAIEKTLKQKSSASLVCSDQKKSLDSISASEKIETVEFSLTSLHSDQRKSQISLQSESPTEPFHSHRKSAVQECLQDSVVSQLEHRTLSDSSAMERKSKSRRKKGEQVPLNPEQRKTDILEEGGGCVFETTSKASKSTSVKSGLVQAKPSTGHGEAAHDGWKDCSWLSPSPPPVQGSTRAGTDFVPSPIPSEDSGKFYFHQATIKEGLHKNQPYSCGLLSPFMAKAIRGDLNEDQQVMRVTAPSPSRIPERQRSSSRSASSKSRSPSPECSPTPSLSNFVSPTRTSWTSSPTLKGMSARSPVYSTSPSFSLSPRPSISPFPLQQRCASSEGTYACSFSTTPTSSRRALTPHGYPSSFSSRSQTHPRSPESMSPLSPFSVLSGKGSRIPRPLDVPALQPRCQTPPSPRKIEAVEFTMCARPSPVVSQSRSRSRSGSPHSGSSASPSANRKTSTVLDSPFPLEVRRPSKSPEIFLTKTPSPRCRVPVISLASTLADRPPQDHSMFSPPSAAATNSRPNRRSVAADNRSSEPIILKGKNKASDGVSKELRWKEDRKRLRNGSHSPSITDSKQTSGSSTNPSATSRSNPSTTSRSTLQSKSSSPSASSRSSFACLESREAERSRRPERPSRPTSRKIQKISREASQDSSVSNRSHEAKLLFDVFK